MDDEVSIDIVTEFRCNKCGTRMASDDQDNDIHTFLATKGNTTFTWELCEPCLEEHFATLTFPPEVVDFESIDLEKMLNQR